MTWMVQASFTSLLFLCSISGLGDSKIIYVCVSSLIDYFKINSQHKLAALLVTISTHTPMAGG